MRTVVKGNAKIISNISYQVIVERHNRQFVCLFGFNVALKHLRSYHDGACL